MTEQDMMLTTILNCRRVDLVSDPKELTYSEQSQFNHMLKRRAYGEPLQYILGSCDFSGTVLSVDKHVLIPRPETEILVELAIEKARLFPSENCIRILDLGTGSGNIAIALAKSGLKVSVTAIDISDNTLAVALKNAEVNNVQHCIEFICQDMACYLSDADKKQAKFDIIISNPPYISTPLLAGLPEDVQQEPKIALDGGLDGLKFYRSIIGFSYRLLSRDGFLIMEIGDNQRKGIESLFKQYPQYTRMSFYKDYVGTDRIVYAQANNCR